MSLLSLDIPNDAADLAIWLEDRLASDSLGELVAELAAVHPVEAPHTETLDELLGPQLKDVLSRGLSVLPEARLRNLLRHPWLLFDLQEQILIDGGKHWSARGSSSAEKAALQRSWSKIETAFAKEAKAPKARPAATTSTAARPRRGSWIGTLSLAAATFVLGVFLRDKLPIPPLEPNPAPPVVAKTGWGWNKPDALKQDVSREVYLTSLADAANEWFKKKPATPAALATRINEFRQGCSTLILAEHKPLPDADRDWLLERCRAWATKLDGHLTAIEAGEDLAKVQEAADQTIKTLIEKIRERAAAA